MPEVLDTPVVESVESSAPASDLDILNAPEATASVESSAPEVVPVVEPEANADGSPQTPVTPAAEPEEEEFPSAPAEALTVRALNEHLAKNPAIQAAVNSNPAFKNLLYSTARLAGTAKDFKGVFQTVDTAKTALQLAQQFNDFQTKFNDPKGGGAALEHLAFAKNPDGSPKLNAQGQPEISPAYLSLVKSYRTELWGYASQSTDPKVQEAVATLAQFMGDAKASASATAQDPAAVADPAVEADRARLREYEARDEAQQGEALQQFNTSIVTGIETAISADVTKVLDNLTSVGNIALSDYMKNVLKEKILGEINDRASKDTAYRAHSKFIYDSSPRSAEGAQKSIGAARAYAKNLLVEVVRKHLTEISQPVLNTQTEKTQKVQAQVSQPNPRGAGGVAPPSRPDPAAKVREYMQAHGGRRPSDRELLDF